MQMQPSQLSTPNVTQAQLRAASNGLVKLRNIAMSRGTYGMRWVAMQDVSASSSFVVALVTSWDRAGKKIYVSWLCGLQQVGNVAWAAWA